MQAPQMNQRECDDTTLKVVLKQAQLHLLEVYRTPNCHLTTGIVILSSQLDNNFIGSKMSLWWENVDNLLDRNKIINLTEMLQGHGLNRLHLSPSRITNYNQTSIDSSTNQNNKLEVGHIVTNILVISVGAAVSSALVS